MDLVGLLLLLPFLKELTLSTLASFYLSPNNFGLIALKVNLLMVTSLSLSLAALDAMVVTTMLLSPGLETTLLTLF